MARYIDYTPEGSNCPTELAPGKYASCSVTNATKLSARDSGLAEKSLVRHGTWHSGQSIRSSTENNPLLQPTNNMEGIVNHENTLWFSVDIDKTYLTDQGVANVYCILKGNIGSQFVAQTTWFPVNEFKQPGDSHFEIGQTEPDNPYYGMVWIEETYDSNYFVDSGIKPVRVKTYTDLISSTILPNGDVINTYDWETIGEYSDNTNVQVNYIPKNLKSANDKCRFVVRSRWQMRFSHTAIDREMALYVYAEGTDELLCKSPIVHLYNKPNTEFPPGTSSPPWYEIPTNIPITTQEIVMELQPGSCALDPNQDYENTVFIDVTDTLEVSYGDSTDCWIMAPDGMPYYLEHTGAGRSSTTINQTGRYTVLGPGEGFVSNPTIDAWLASNGWPAWNDPVAGILYNPQFANTIGMTYISSFDDVFVGSAVGYRLFKDVTGDFELPPFQDLGSFYETFMNATDFTDSANIVNTWATDNATTFSNTFAGCSNFNAPLNNWNTQNVTAMDGMFSNCSVFNQDISMWDTRNVTNMQEMFRGASVYNSPMYQWDVSDVTNMIGMFRDASIFDQNISTWDVSGIPSKPSNFDLNTTSDWTEFEKPWWGATVRPHSPYYFVLDLQTGSQLRLTTQGDTNIRVFKNNKTYVTTILGSEGSAPKLTAINSDIPVVIYGTTQALGFRDLRINQYAVNVTHDTNSWEYIDHEANSDVNITTSDITSDINNHMTFNTVTLSNLYNNMANIVMLGNNNDWDGLFDVCEGLAQGAFSACGRLPDDLPANLIFGWNNMTADQSKSIMKDAFRSTTNFPGNVITDTWTVRANTTEMVLDGTFSLMPDSSNVSPFLDNLLALSDTTSCIRTHQGSNISAINLSNTAHKISSLEQTYRYAGLSDTSSSTQLTHCDQSENTNFSQAFMFSSGSNTFVSSYNQPMYQANTDCSYEFAYTTNVPTNITNWDFTNSSNISCMFYKSQFPTNFSNVDLSSYDTSVDTRPRTTDYNFSYYNADTTHNENRPYAKCHHVFTGCAGTPTTMSNWTLPQPKPTYIKGVYTYRDVLMPWWFAGCSNFAADISDWTTTAAPTSDPVSSVRLGTFALCSNFNSNIDWYYPDPVYYDLASLPDNLDLMSEFNLSVDNWDRTLYQHNPEKKRLDLALYGRLSYHHVWWRTFWEADSYNNGGSSVPTIMATDMVDTFRGSGINSDITIRKPVWGKGFYQGVFQDTTAWTSGKTIDFECQNRVDHALENVYYHSIFAQRMFKDTNFNGTLGSGWKWFWFNVSNSNGCNYQATGLDKDWSGWANITVRADLVAREAANTLPAVQTGSATDSYGVKPVYYDTALKSTDLGYNRAPVGNLTDTSARIRAQSDPTEPEYVNYQSNTGLTDLAWAPTGAIRIITDYCPRPNWHNFTQDGRPKDTSNYNWQLRSATAAYYSMWGNQSYQRGRCRVELDNLAEMFSGATNFTQDLSGYRTRWTPPSGAFTEDQNMNWSYDAWFGSGQAKPYASFNRRNEINAYVTNFADGRFLISPNQDIISSYALAGLETYCDFRHNVADFPPNYLESRSDYIPSLYPYYYSNVVGFKISEYEIQLVSNYYNPPVTGANYTCGTQNSPTYEIFRVVPGAEMLFTEGSSPIPGTTVNYTAVAGPGRIYQSQTDPNRWLVKHDNFWFDWGIIENPSSDPTSVSAGTVITATKWYDITQNYRTSNFSGDQNLIYSWVPYAWTPGYEAANIYFPEYADYLLENGHAYNSFGDSNGTIDFGTPTKFSDPPKSDMDVLYQDTYALGVNTAWNPIEPASQTSLWHGYKHTPENFATGATGFTSGKWPTWMVGYTESPQGVSDINTHFTSARPVGDSRYITNYPWSQEPYGWPTNAIYTGGTY